MGLIQPGSYNATVCEERLLAWQDNFASFDQLSLVINFWPNKGHTTSMQQQGSNFQIWSKRNPDDVMFEKCIYYGLHLAHFYNSQNCDRFFWKIDG